jgi:catechol 2,3-dioxygenase-like lactoylglutathione lyase family enzyme
MLFVFHSSIRAQEKQQDHPNFDFQYDHYSLIVKDLDKTGAFYKDILNLEEIPHPSASSGFRWFRIHGNSQLHLIGKDSVAMEHSKSVHLCLATQHLDALIDYLKAKDIPFSDWPGKANAVTLRADGVRQIYIQDPENNWVEINDAVHPSN